MILPRLPRFLRLSPINPPLPLPLRIRPFTSASVLHIKSFPPRPKPPPDSEVEESFLKGSGPGGQKINKTSSAVQLKHLPTGIVVKSQATRSRSQNRKHARELLAQKVDDLRNGDQSRSAIVGDIKKKRSSSAAKKSRRKYRLLEEGKEQQAEDEDDGKAGADVTGDDAAAAAPDPNTTAADSTTSSHAGAPTNDKGEARHDNSSQRHPNPSSQIKKL